MKRYFPAKERNPSPPHKRDYSLLITLAYLNHQHDTKLRGGCQAPYDTISTMPETNENIDAQSGRFFCHPVAFEGRS